MYRQVMYALLTLLAVALLFSITGQIAYNPLSMIIGLIILVITALLVNYLMSYIFKVKPHQESAIITALILFFVFTPPNNLRDFVVFGLLAGFAMASKYLIVWRGRHIANPAAISAVIVGAIGLQFASWWVATGSLLIPTIVLGGLVLYKNKRIKMGLLYVVVGFVTALIVSFNQGTSLIDAAPIILMSYPILYLAAFMLTEPLTLPPRRYQRYIVAVFVAVIVNAQLHIASITITPEIGLVIGNIIAFMFTQRATIGLKLLSKKPLGPTQIEYVFEPTRRPNYLPGQYLELTLPHANADMRATRRMFTVASSPTSKEIRIGVRHNTPSSSFKKALKQLPVGTILKTTGIYGDFLLPNDTKQKVLMVAGGIGVTPFRAQVEYLADSDESRNVILLHFVSSKDDAIYGDVFEKARKKGITVHVITNRIDEAIVKKLVPDVSERAIFVSGPPPMVDGAKQVLSSLGARSVTTDYFSGY